jgi:hypothetical protein
MDEHQMNCCNLLKPAPRDISAYHQRLIEADALRRGEFPVFKSAKTDISGNNVMICWLETIEAAAGLFEDEQDWLDLSGEEIAILLGLKHVGKEWGLLGNMAVAGKAVQTFKQLTDVRKFIRDQLDFVVRAKNVGNVAANVIGSISQLPNFSTGIATRLIALARPEFGVSVNNGSAPGLARLMGWRANPTALASPKNYSMPLRMDIRAALAQIT